MQKNVSYVQNVQKCRILVENLRNLRRSCQFKVEAVSMLKLCQKMLENVVEVVRKNVECKSSQSCVEKYRMLKS